MSITFACGNCGKSFTIDDKFAGKKGRCKQCGEVMDIPEGGPSRSTPSSKAREISPSRRPPGPTPADPSKADVYGFEDDHGPPRPGAAVEDMPPLAPRSASKSTGMYDPPKRKKKGSDGGGTFKVILRIAVGVVLGFLGLGVVGVALRSIQTSLIPGLSSKGDIEAILRERVALNQELAAILAKVDDVESARANSAQAIRKVQGISANLRKLKATKGLQTDLDSLKRQYRVPQEQSTQQAVEQVRRVVVIPDVWQALNLQAAMDELDREEKSVPGIIPADSSPPPPANVPGLPPGINPAPPPGMPPGPGNAPRPGNRRGSPRPGQGNRPGPGGPG